MMKVWPFVFILFLSLSGNASENSMDTPKEEKLNLESAGPSKSRLELHWNRGTGLCEMQNSIDSKKWKKSKLQICKNVFSFFKSHSAELVKEFESSQFSKKGNPIPISTSEHILSYRQWIFKVTLNKKEVCTDSELKNCTKPVDTMAENWAKLLVSEVFSTDSSENINSLKNEKSKKPR